LPPHWREIPFFLSRTILRTASPTISSKTTATTIVPICLPPAIYDFYINKVYTKNTVFFFKPDEKVYQTFSLDAWQPDRKSLRFRRLFCVASNPPKKP
jgi:hypothetical protein